MLFEGLDYPYQVLKREQYDIGRLHIIKDMFEIDGEAYPYTYFSMKDGVCVFPVCEEGIILIEQYRHNLNRWMLEVPAGGIEDGETPQEAAKRELKEETGYLVEELTNLGYYYANEGVSTARCTLFFAHCKEKTLMQPEKSELIRVKIVKKEEFQEMIETNQFHLLIGLVGWYRAREKKLI